MAKQPTYKWPKTMGGQVDRLYKLREQRQVLTKQVNQIKAEETALTEYLIGQNTKEHLQGAMGRVAKLSLTPKVVPTLEDKLAALRWAARRKIFIFQSRLSEGVINELWQDGKEIDGVGQFDTIKTSLTKR